MGFGPAQGGGGGIGNHRVVAYLTADQTVASGAGLTALAFNAEKVDTDGYHDNATNNSRFTIPAGRGGGYIFDFSGRWVTYTNTNAVLIRIRKNGADIVGTLYFTPALVDDCDMIPLVGYVDLVAGDYLEVCVSQSTGGDRAFDGGDPDSVPTAARFAMVQVN